MPLLQDKVVLVTGAGRGIGRAVSVAMAAAGARLLLNDLGCDVEGRGADPSVVESAVAEARALGAAAHADPSDVRQSGAAEALVARALDSYNRLDSVVLCAGIARPGGILKLTDEDLEQTWAVHGRSTYRMVKAAAQVMVEQGHGGSITVMTSPASHFGGARDSAATGAQAAANALVRSASVELRRHGIRINSVAPTARTRLTEQRPLFQGIAADSMGPEQVAPLAVFLASDLASDISGETLGAGGGRIYTIRTRETTGALLEADTMSAEGIADKWRDISQ